MNNDENKTTNNIQLDLTGLPANLIYSPYELEKWLADTNVPLSNEEIVDMSAYFNENNLCTTNEIFNIIEVDKDNKKQTK